MLEGYDTKWSDWINDTTTVVSDVANGNYTLKVRSRDPSGNLDPTPAIRKIHFRNNHLLSVVSSHGQVYGEGSYQENSIVYIGVSPLIVTVHPNTRYIIDGWKLSSARGYFGIASDADIKIRSNVSQTALWHTEYLLEINSEIPIEGYGWYEEGSTVVLALTSPQGGLIRNVFKGWEGDFVSINERISVHMHGLKRLRVDWLTDYSIIYQSLIFIVIITTMDFNFMRK